MEKRIMNLNSSVRVMKMEYSFMYTVSNRIAKDKGISNTPSVLKEVLIYLRDKGWVSEDLKEYGLDQLKYKNYPSLVEDNNSLVNVFVNMLYDKVPKLN